jgi:hypothetical protein
MMAKALYQPELHPRTKEILSHTAKPVKVSEQLGEGVNARIALWITTHVGTMGCAYLFALITFISLPSVLKQAGYYHGPDFGSGTVIVVAWIAQTFLQLVLLSIIMVGQAVQASASDKRAADTYRDAEAVLHEALQIQEHLNAQDEEIVAIKAAVVKG